MESELIELAQLRNSRIKDHHAYRTESKIGIGDDFCCHREAVNRHSEPAIVWSSTGEVMGHISDRLAQILSPMLDNGHIIRKIIGTITGPARSAPEGVWRIGWN